MVCSVIWNFPDILGERLREWEHRPQPVSHTERMAIELLCLMGGLKREEIPGAKVDGKKLSSQHFPN